MDRGRGNLPQPDSGVTDSAIGTADYPERVLARIEEASLPSQWFAALHLLVGSSDHRMPMSRLARDLSMTSGGFTKLADRTGAAARPCPVGAAGSRGTADW